MENIKVFWISGSAPAWRVLLTLELKGLRYDSRILQTSKKEQKEPWYLALSPRGQVPLLLDGSVSVSESLAIMHYLEKQYPQVALFGKSAGETALIEQTTHEIIEYTDKAVTAFVQPVFRNKTDELAANYDRIAIPLHNELSLIEKRLGESHWLNGNISAADVTLVPTMQRLLRAVGKAPNFADQYNLGNLDSTYPNLTNWISNTEALPQFDRSFPPHWRI